MSTCARDPGVTGRRATLDSPSTRGEPRSAVIRSPSTVRVFTPSRVPIGIGCGRVGEALLDQVPGEDPDAVAAHLRDRAVGVAVVHEPPVAGADDAQHAVAADAGPPVAERAHPVRHLLVGQVAVDRAVVVGQQHEVVLRAVALEERVAQALPAPYRPWE